MLSKQELQELRDQWKTIVEISTTLDMWYHATRNHLIALGIFSTWEAMTRLSRIKTDKIASRVDEIILELKKGTSLRDVSRKLWLKYRTLCTNLKEYGVWIRNWIIIDYGTFMPWKRDCLDCWCITSINNRRCQSCLNHRKPRR